MTFIKRAAIFSLFVAFMATPQTAEATPGGATIFPPTVIVIERHPVEAFPELPESMREGCEFDQRKIIDALPPIKNYWYVVPKWLAGEFAYGEMVCDWEKNYQTGKKVHPDRTIPASKSGRRRGMLVDKKGNIWQMSKAGAIGSSNAGDPEYRRFDSDIVGFSTAPNEYYEMTESIEFRVGEDSKIKQVTRMQRVRDFRLNEENTVCVYLEEIHYDQQGHALRGEKADGTMHKVHEFEPMTEANERSKGAYQEALGKLRAFMKEDGEGADAP